MTFYPIDRPLLRFITKLTLAFACLFLLSCYSVCAQGTWTALTDTAPNLNNGVMLLLTDGSVITITIDDPRAVYDDSASAIWNKLTPDSTGSYVHGKWSVIAPMHQSRIYFSSQVLQNGKVYIAGGEFGTGGNAAELYDPANNTWTDIPGLPPEYKLADANSAMLPDGRVLQNSVYGTGQYGVTNFIYNPVTDSISFAAPCGYPDDESSWLKLPDYSILYEAVNSTSTQRYIPGLQNWVNDSATPESLYDVYGSETGPGLVLPDGRGFFFGSNGKTVYYTPTGNIAAGHFTQGPQIPAGLGTPDAPAAMMNDGHILCVFAPAPNAVATDSIFHPISYFYEFDYTTNTFTPLTAPNGAPSLNQPSCSSIMLCLPDGNVLLGVEGSNQYYIYTPANAPLAEGKPVIHAISAQDCNYMITGTMFNGITEGAAYGDDWQMATNYPIIRLMANGKTWFARSTNWNRTGIQTGMLADTTYFTVPSNLPDGDYSLLLSANGNSSDTFSFTYGNCTTGLSNLTKDIQSFKVIPNPAHQSASVIYESDVNSDYVLRITDVCGKLMHSENLNATVGNNESSFKLDHCAPGVYTVTILSGPRLCETKLVVY